MENIDLSRRVQHFQLIAQEKLQTLICSIPGNNKDLIIEPTLIKPLEYICTAPWLRLKGIQRILKFDACNAIPRLSDDHVQIYMLRSNNTTINHILKQIKHTQTVYHESRKSTVITDENIAFKTYHLICVPTCFVYFHTLIETEGLCDCVCLHRFNWDFIPLDDFLLSMEIQNVFDRIYLKSDCSLLPTITQSFRLLQLICGHAALTVTYGEYSQNILFMLSKMPKLVGRSTQHPDTANEFNMILMIDRNMDYVAPLLTPATYSGLLLEVFEYNAGFLKLHNDGNKITEQKLSIFNVEKIENDSEISTDASVTTNQSKSFSSFRLNGAHDIIYRDNRYKHFGAASSDIRSQAKTIGGEAQKLNQMKLQDIHDYVRRKLPEITNLKEKLLCHLNASEKLIQMLGGSYHKIQNLEYKILNNTISKKNILKEIDEILVTDGQRYNTPRLLCLVHLCLGLKNMELSNFMQNYCNYFGRDCLLAFQKLATAGLLPHLSENKSITLLPESLTSLAISSSLVSANPLIQKGRTKNIFKNMPLNITKTQQNLFKLHCNRLGLLLTESESKELDKVKDKDQSTNHAAALSLSPTKQNNYSAKHLSPSYVYNNLYIPLVAQLCSHILKAENTNDFSTKLSAFDDLRINGVTVENYNQSVKKGDFPELLPLKNRNVLIYMLGGVSYAEIAACQLVAKLTESKIYIASDSILSGSDLISNAFK